jgi:hypothetical protein
MKKAIYFVWKAVEGKSGVKVKMASRGKYGTPKMVENPDGLDIIDKAPTRLFFSGISKEQLQVAVDKAITKQKAAIDKDQKYKAAAPARKAEAAKYQAEKRKNNLAEYEKKYGKGTWNRVTYKQEGGDDGYSYVLRVDGRSKYSGLTQREAMYYKELEVDKLAKAAGLGKYAKQSPTVKESVEEDDVKASAEKLKDLLLSRKWENVKIRPATPKEVKRINDTFKASFNFNIDSALVVEAVALSANVKAFVFDSAKGVRFWVRSNAGGDLSGTVEVAASSVAIQTEKLTWRDLENR